MEGEASRASHLTIAKRGFVQAETCLEHTSIRSLSQSPAPIGFLYGVAGIHEGQKTSVRVVQIPSRKGKRSQGSAIHYCVLGFLQMARFRQHRSPGCRHETGQTPSQKGIGKGSAVRRSCWSTLPDSKKPDVRSAADPGRFLSGCAKHKYNQCIGRHRVHRYDLTSPWQVMTPSPSRHQPATLRPCAQK